MPKVKYTPARYVPLVNNEDGVPVSVSFNYSSVIGMLIFLSRHTCPYIAFAVNFCARYMFCPKHSHEEALKQISQYLKLTRDCGLVLNPNVDLFKIYSYPYAYFDGMYGHENLTCPECVNSCTGYVSTFSYCPVL